MSEESEPILGVLKRIREEAQKPRGTAGYLYMCAGIFLASAGVGGLGNSVVSWCIAAAGAFLAWSVALVLLGRLLERGDAAVLAHLYGEAKKEVARLNRALGESTRPKQLELLEPKKP